MFLSYIPHDVPISPVYLDDMPMIWVPGADGDDCEPAAAAAAAATAAVLEERSAKLCVAFHGICFNGEYMGISWGYLGIERGRYHGVRIWEYSEVITWINGDIEWI